jgi:hypothetical protein
MWSDNPRVGPAIALGQKGAMTMEYTNNSFPNSSFEEDLAMRKTTHVFDGIPTFFRACCHDVARRNVSAGYDYPARELVRHLERLSPYSADDEAWASELGDLARLIDAQDDDAVLRWFLDHYPKCLALVPKRRRPAFLQGVYEAVEEFSVLDHLNGEEVSR